jgi:filamentous hemagglutinin
VTVVEQRVSAARGSIQQIADGLPGRNLLNGEIVVDPSSIGGVGGALQGLRLRAASRGVLSAADANAPHLAAGRRPPYAAGSRAREIVLQQERSLVRVHGEGNQARSWLMRVEEIEGLSPAQIKDKFALPEMPRYVSDVQVPKGTRMRVGTVGEQAGWGRGGGTQYELLDRLPETAFRNRRPLE